MHRCLFWTAGLKEFNSMDILFILLHRCDYQRAVRLDPMCLPARVNLAYTLQVSGRFMQAWRQFTTAIDLKPSKFFFFFCSG